MDNRYEEGGLLAVLLAAVVALWRWLRHLDSRRSERLDELEKSEAERLARLEETIKRKLTEDEKK
jgi:membrane protein implicated in regulation of membrane protease activity